MLAESQLKIGKSGAFWRPAPFFRARRRFLFLANSPPNIKTNISKLAFPVSSNTGQGRWVLSTPDVKLYCEQCDGERFFANGEGEGFFWEKAPLIHLESDSEKFLFLKFNCRNCLFTPKVYALLVERSGATGDGFARKLGEIPAFGPRTPARVISLAGPDRDLFLQGRRAECLGLGIGAFSYYRRVVENQKARIIEEIEKVARKLNASPEILKDLQAAAKETQFTTAIEQIKHGLPETLLIDGQHNPLALLHSALSEGLHARNDEDCLSLAQDIRLVLSSLAEKIGQALKQ